MARRTGGFRRTPPKRTLTPSTRSRTTPSSPRRRLPPTQSTRSRTRTGRVSAQPVFVSAAFGGAGSRAGRSVIRASVRRQRVFPRKTTGARGRKPVRTGGGRLVGIGTTIGTRRRPKRSRPKTVTFRPTGRRVKSGQGITFVRGARGKIKAVKRTRKARVRVLGRRVIRRAKKVRVRTRPKSKVRVRSRTGKLIRVSSRSRLARKKRARRPTRRPIRKTKPKVRPARAITRVLGTRVVQRRRTRKPRKLRVVRGARGKVKRVKTRREVIRVSTRPRGQRLRIVRGARGRVRRIGFTPPPRRSLRANPLTSLFAGQLPQGRRRIGTDFDVLSGF